MDFDKARFNMVEQQIRPWNVLDTDVLDTLMLIRREQFVAPAQQDLAFADIELPIGSGQCMLSPKVEARVLQALALRNGESVLEVGAGSGYMAALMAARAEWVRSIEIEPALARLAADNLAAAGVDNAIVQEGDGLLGLPERAPFDAIVLSGAVDEVPAALLAQLKVGGRLFAFVGQAPVMQARLVRCVGEGQYASSDLFETVVPALRCTRKPSFAF